MAKIVIEVSDGVTKGDIIQNICSMWIVYRDTDVEVTVSKEEWNAPYNPHKVGDTDVSNNKEAIKILQNERNRLCKILDKAVPYKRQRTLVALDMAIQALKDEDEMKVPE